MDFSTASLGGPRARPTFRACSLATRDKRLVWRAIGQDALEFFVRQWPWGRLDEVVKLLARRYDNAREPHIPAKLPHPCVGPHQFLELVDVQPGELCHLLCNN